VSEAEALVAGRVADVLVTNEIVGKQKVARLSRLAREAKVGVLADDAGNVASSTPRRAPSACGWTCSSRSTSARTAAASRPANPRSPCARAIAACGNLRCCRPARLSRGRAAPAFRG